MSGSQPPYVLGSFPVGNASATGAFAGLPPVILSQYLADALAALHKLDCGEKEAVVSYGEGSGQKSVTFTRTTEYALRNHIDELKRALGLMGRRSAIPVVFT